MTRHVRKLALAATAGMAILAGTAFAALPQKGPFAGTTSAHPINGFKDGVQFIVINNGRTLHDFTFGTLGCFGTGAFPVGVDPFALASSVGRVSTIPVSPTGTFLVTTKPRFADTQGGIVTTAVIQGTFTSATAVKGTITISQTFKTDKCGPAKMTFTAAPGRPDDSSGP
jgi:hypothetical protein